MIQIIPDGNWSLTQWDVDRYITINGLDELADTEIHIASDSDSYGAYVVLPESGDSGTTAVIPNIVLTYAGMVNIYVYQNKRTIYHTAIPVTAREKPDDYIYTPSEVDGYIRIKEEEAKRQAAEAMREAAEAERAAAEADREVAEDERESAEAERVAAEAERVKAEAERDSAEEARVAAELQRQSAESMRASAESARVTAESRRETSEDSRVSAENARVAAEKTRSEAEALRAAAEIERVSAETERDSAEEARAAAEQLRVTSEARRVTAESARVTAEQERVIAEAERADRDTGIVAQATAAADRAAASATNASESASRSSAAADIAIAKSDEASASAAEANDSAMLSESWAIGGTGTREGEDKNNAKYWCEQAEQIAGGDYAPKIHKHDAIDVVSGTFDNERIPIIPVTKGGTNAATAEQARANLGVETKHLSSTVTIPSSGWSDNSQTVNVSGMTATLDIVIVPAPDSYENWGKFGVYCSAQGEGTLAFVCKNIPDTELTANLLILKG